MSKKKIKPDTTLSLALLLAQERMSAAARESYHDEEASFGYLGKLEDCLPDALAFVIRCRKAEAL